MRRTRTSPLFIAALLFAQGAVGEAAAAALYPTSFVLQRKKPVATLHIRNDQQTRRTFELTAMTWRQENGEDALSPDADLIVTPPILSLNPGEDAIVRIGLLSADKAGPDEQAYRLVINDITAPKRLKPNELDIRLRIMLPVFLAAIAPNGAPGFSADYSVRGGRLCVRGRNAGRRHVKMVWLESGGDSQTRVPTHQYFLAGSEAEVCAGSLPADAASRPLIAGLSSAYQPSVTPYEIQKTRILASSPGE